MTKEKPTTSPAGWHPDPTASGRLRYWDGAAWTQHVLPADAAPSPPETPVPSAAPEAPEKRGLLSSTRSKVIAGVAAAALIAATGGTVWAVTSFSSSGAASPEEAVARTAQALTEGDSVGLFNSFAPSEVSHFQPGLENLLTFIDAEGLVDSENPLITVGLENIETSTETMVEGEVEKVSLASGTLTIDGDPQEIAEALYQLSPDGFLLRFFVATNVDTANMPLASGAETEGSSDTSGTQSRGDLVNEFLEFNQTARGTYPKSELINEAVSMFEDIGLPLEIDVSEIADEFSVEEFSFFTVQENGGWFVSPLMTGTLQYPNAPEDLTFDPGTEFATPEESLIDFCAYPPDNPDMAKYAFTTVTVAERRLASFGSRMTDDFYALCEEVKSAVSSDLTLLERAGLSPSERLTQEREDMEAMEAALSKVTTKIDGNTAVMSLPKGSYNGAGSPEDFPLVAVREGNSWRFSPLATYGKRFETISLMAQDVASQVSTYESSTGSARADEESETSPSESGAATKAPASEESSRSAPVLEVPGSGAAPIPAGATKLCVFGTTKEFEFYLFQNPDDPGGDEWIYVGGNQALGYLELPAVPVSSAGGGVAGHRMTNTDGTSYYLTGHELTVTPPEGEGFYQTVRSWEQFGC